MIACEVTCKFLHLYSFEESELFLNNVSIGKILNVNAQRDVEPREGIINDEDMCKLVTCLSGDSFYKRHMKAHALLQIKQSQV